MQGPQPLPKFPKNINGWFSRLSGNEFKVLAYIVRKTWGFNKLEDRISYSQFLKGIVDKKGVWVLDGLGMGRTTLNRCLVSLERKGFIVIVRGRGKTSRYQLRYKEAGCQHCHDTKYVENSENRTVMMPCQDCH